MGKSTACEQLAALWSGEASAPVPIFVRLSNIAPRLQRSADLTVALLVEEAASGAPVEEMMSLRQALEDAVQTGHAVLLLDGLDETGEKRGLLTDGLSEIHGALPASVSMILATRSSALHAARKLGFPEAELATPLWLDDTLEQLLRHIGAKHRPASEATQWVNERIAWLQDAKATNVDVWSVPLLATLLVLLAAEHPATTLPASRAKLLSQAVEESVDRWERRRVSSSLSPEPMKPALTRDQLLDGYREIGHLLSTRVSTEIPTANSAVINMLARRWSKSTGEAAEATREILQFWDAQVGVFVSRDGQFLEPRSRVFAEVGDAMWAVQQESEARREWTIQALGDEVRREALLLAAGLSSKITLHLIDIATSNDPKQSGEERDRALRWAARTIFDGQTVESQQVAILIDALGNAANSTAPEPPEKPQGFLAGFWRDSNQWRLARDLSYLPLPEDLRSQRDDWLSRLALTSEQRILTNTFAMLADATFDGIEHLPPDVVEAVHAMLVLPIDSGPSLERREVPDQRSKRAKPWAGHIDAVERAIAYINQFPAGSADCAYRIAHHGSHGQYRRIASGLTTLGHPAPDAIEEELTFDPNAPDEFDQILDYLYAAIGRAAEPAPDIDLVTRWKLTDLYKLCSFLRIGAMTINDCRPILQTNPDQLTNWVRAVAHALSLDLSLLSKQAYYVLSPEANSRDDFAHLLFTPPHSQSVIDASSLKSEEIALLVESLGHESYSIAYAALLVLQRSSAADVLQRIVDLLPTMPNARRPNAAALASLLGRNQAETIRIFLEGADPGARRGAALALGLLTERSEATDGLRNRALAHDDMAVRVAAGADRSVAEQASYWSCLRCAQPNVITADKCEHCAARTRPIEHKNKVADPFAHEE